MEWAVIAAGAIPAAFTALLTLAVGTKMGLGPVVKERREEDAALITTLRHRLDLVERENATLKADNAQLARRLERLEDRVLRNALGEREEGR